MSSERDFPVCFIWAHFTAKKRISAWFSPIMQTNVIFFWKKGRPRQTIRASCTLWKILEYISEAWKARLSIPLVPPKPFQNSIHEVHIWSLPKHKLFRRVELNFIDEELTNEGSLERHVRNFKSITLMKLHSCTYRHRSLIRGNDPSSSSGFQKHATRPGDNFSPRLKLRRKRFRRVTCEGELWNFNTTVIRNIAVLSFKCCRTMTD